MLVEFLLGTIVFLSALIGGEHGLLHRKGGLYGGLCEFRFGLLLLVPECDAAQRSGRPARGAEGRSARKGGGDSLQRDERDNRSLLGTDDGDERGDRDGECDKLGRERGEGQRYLDTVRGVQRSEPGRAGRARTLVCGAARSAGRLERRALDGRAPWTPELELELELALLASHFSLLSVTCDFDFLLLLLTSSTDLSSSLSTVRTS